jgi:ribose transport system substrate-binding protein
MMRLRFMVVVGLLAAAVTIAGCGSSGSGSGSSSASSESGSSGESGSSEFVKKEPLKVGYSSFDLKQPYFQLYAKGIEEEAGKLGFEYVESDQKSSEQLQVSGSSDLITQGISGLINSPIQPEALPATVTQAHAAKIPVVIGDVGASGDYDAYVLSNNTKGGELAGEYMVEQLEKKPGTKKVAVLELPPGLEVGEERVEGFENIVKNAPGFEIVSNLNGEAEPQGGFKASQDALSANSDLAGIFTANDPMGEGAQQAIAQAGKGKKVMLVSFNGDPPALTLVEQGTMAATVAQDPYTQGITAMEAISQLLNGEKVPFTDPGKKIIEVPVKLVTQENVKEDQELNAELLGE